MGKVFEYILKIAVTPREHPDDFCESWDLGNDQGSWEEYIKEQAQYYIELNCEAVEGDVIIELVRTNE